MEDNVERVMLYQKMLDVVQEVIQERHRQNTTWGVAHDDQHDNITWGMLFEDRVHQMVSYPPPNSVSRDRRLLIEIAALAVAAVESIDRKAG